MAEKRREFYIGPHLADHPNVLACEPLESMALWVLCGSWMASQTDHAVGFVPVNVPDAMPAFRRRHVPALVNAGLWDIGDDEGVPGYWMLLEKELWKVAVRSVKVWPGRWIDPARRAAIYARDGYACQVCGATDRLSLDHRMPRSRGGDHADENLWTLCRRCNSRKGTRTVEEWLVSSGA